MFHCAITNDVASNPLPPPHPELLKFFNPPKRAVRRAREPLEGCKSLFKVKEGNINLLGKLNHYFVTDAFCSPQEGSQDQEGWSCPC
jgi:hypothetical protein